MKFWLATSVIFFNQFVHNCQFDTIQSQTGSRLTPFYYHFEAPKLLLRWQLTVGGLADLFIIFKVTYSKAARLQVQFTWTVLQAPTTVVRSVTVALSLNVIPFIPVDFLQ